MTYKYIKLKCRICKQPFLIELTNKKPLILCPGGKHSITTSAGLKTNEDPAPPELPLVK